MNTDILDKFTTHLKNVLTGALCDATEANESVIEPIHLFCSLGMQKGSIGTEILYKTKIPASAFLKLMKKTDGKKCSAKKNTALGALPKLSDGAKRAIEKAVLTANVYEHKYVGTEHLLSGLLQINDEAIKKFLEENKIDPKILKQQITAVLKSTSKFPEITSSLGVAGDDAAMMMGGEAVREKKRGKKQAIKTPALDFFSIDLTKPEIQAGIDPVIGREEEIERVMQILCRRTKNNPILLGDPGVGKTALVEGLAKKICRGEVPDVLSGKRLLALDLTLVVAGTMYRGEFEGRLKQIIDEVKMNPDIILFIDEVHTIIGAGSSSGSLDAANILKPALARGEIRCIGATTPPEYKKHIESDAALERRFQSVMINEPTAEKTIKILDGIKKNYENYHGVTITKDAIETAVTLADRYLQDKFFPDKAIDLIDEAASSLRVKQKPSATWRRAKKTEDELNQIRHEKQIAVTEERFIEAISLKERERDLENELGKLEQKTKKRITGTGKITAEHITEIISRMTGIPIHELLDSEKERLIKLEETLGKKILGQKETTRAVADFVRRAKIGISNPNRPLASFLFVGPSGVGKTELAKTLAEEVFQDKDALVQLDMSEFSEGFTVSKLIGAPAGYVGYKDSAKLTDAVKKKPYSVVLFDELEKAHPDILNLLLQILDAGHITDAVGKKINFKNTIIIMTSNIGSENLRKPELGFSSGASEFSNLASDIQTALKERFRPEFLNRIDRVCVFETLDKETLGKIVDLYIDELNERLNLQNIQIVIDADVKDWIINSGTSPEHGARAIRRVIQDNIENQLASLLLLGKTHPRVARFVIKDEKPVIEI